MITSLTVANKAIHPSVGFSGSEQKGPEDNPGLLPWRGLTALLPDLLNSAVIRPYKPCKWDRGILGWIYPSGLKDSLNFWYRQ
jgi:hypothetical protein